MLKSGTLFSFYQFLEITGEMGHGANETSQAFSI